MRRIGYNIKQAFLQIGRNKGMSLASTLAITAMLLVLGLFFVTIVNVNLFSEMVKSDYDEVEIFLEDGMTMDKAQGIMNKIDEIEGVDETSYRTRDEAMDIMKKRWGENAYLLDSLGDNPLPDSIRVKVSDINAAEKVSNLAEKTDGVEDVRYYRDTVEKLTRLTKNLQIGAAVVMIFMVLVSVAVVSNTVKLTVFARAGEISMMKYIGASNWFIRGPFLVEGMLIGAVSSGIASVITYFIYRNIESTVGMRMLAMLSTPLVPASYLEANLVIIFLAIGVSVGAFGSIISMRKFLK